MGPISTTGPMTVYRKHLGGVTQRIVSQNTTEQIAAYENLIADAARFSTILTSQQRNFLRPHLYRYNLMLTQDYLQLGNRKQARSKLITLSFIPIDRVLRHLKEVTQMVTLCYLPPSVLRIIRTRWARKAPSYPVGKPT